jgi:hypothetical protein
LSLLPARAGYRGGNGVRRREIGGGWQACGLLCDGFGGLKRESCEEEWEVDDIDGVIAAEE